MIKRICLFTVGLFIMSVGVAFSIVSMLGTTPISSISYSLTLITNINIGITTFLFNAALIFIQMIILRSRFRKKRLLQFINCVLFGYFTDLALYIVSFVPFDNSILYSVLFLIREALREGLLNAVVHKAYESLTPIQIAVYDNKLEIFNNQNSFRCDNGGHISDSVWVVLYKRFWCDKYRNRHICIHGWLYVKTNFQCIR